MANYPKPFLFKWAVAVFVVMGLFTAGCSKKRNADAAPLTSDATVDLGSVQQIIRGFGGATVFRPVVPLTTDELNKLFGTGDGQIGLSILRIRVASDDDAAWRSLELANAKGARDRGAIVIATPWSPPARMKTNNSLIGGALIKDSAAAYATYLNDFAKYMSANGAPLYAVSIQNEPDWKATYESCEWTAADFVDFLKNDGSLITDAKVIAPESLNFNKNMSDPFLMDDGAAANVDIVGGHIYGGGLASYPLAKLKGKETWMTEHLDTNIVWNAVLATAKEIHDCMTVANFSAYVWWYAKRFYGPLGENGEVTKRGYVMANFAKFIRPGYARVSATATGADVLISAYKGNKMVIVAVNMGNADNSIQCSLQNGTVSSVTPYVTSQTDNLSKKQSITVQNNGFRFSLPAQSVTTFVQD